MFGTISMATDSCLHANGCIISYHSWQEFGMAAILFKTFGECTILDYGMHATVVSN